MTHQLSYRPISLMLLFVLALIGCTSSPMPARTSTPVISATASGTERQPMQDTPTLPGPMAMPTFTQSIDTPTPRPKIIPTSTPVLFLATQEEALAFIKHMQTTNGGCELPCWWGITPGETTAQDAARILYPLKNFPGLRSEYGFHLDEYSQIDVGIYANAPSRPIEFIRIYGFIPFEKPSEHFDASWQGYFVPNLLARLGKPSEVWIGFGRPAGDLNPNPPGSIPFSYELFVFYSDLGIRVQYLGYATKGDLNQACLSLDRLHQIRIFMQRRSAGPLVGPPAEPFTQQYPISEVTHLSVETFYEKFRSLNTQACLESPAKFWP